MKALLIVVSDKDVLPQSIRQVMNDEYGPFWEVVQLPRKLNPLSGHRVTSHYDVTQIFEYLDNRFKCLKDDEFVDVIIGIHEFEKITGLLLVSRLAEAVSAHRVVDTLGVNHSADSLSVRRVRIVVFLSMTECRLLTVASL